jgi:hypothetical protein
MTVPFSARFASILAAITLFVVITTPLINKAAAIMAA